MSGLVVAAVCFAYLAVSFAFARRAYRHEYHLIYGSPAPQIYGGRHGHDKAHDVAMSEASKWLAMWPFYCAWDVIYWLIAHGTRQTWVESANEVAQMQTEVDRLAVDQDPLKDLDHEQDGIRVTQKQPAPCPCGYVTECHIHCGDGSCHRTARSRQDEHGSPVFTGTEIIRTHHPERITERTFDGKTVIDIPGCQCKKCKE